MKSSQPTVRSLIPSVTALARELGVTTAAVYHWIKLDRIPGRHMPEVAKFYDMEVGDLVQFAQSDSIRQKVIRRKPKETLPICIQVQDGAMDEREAAKQLGVHVQTIRGILTNWGPDLRTLYSTLLALDAGTMSVDQATLVLKVSKQNVHILRNKYGFKPAPKAKAAPRSIVRRRVTTKEAALACIAGKYTLNEVEEHYQVSWRTVHRAISKLSPDYSMINLTHWPKVFREAYAEEIDKKSPKMIGNLWEYAKNKQVTLKKWAKYPKPPADWWKAPVRVLLIHVLLDSLSLESVAQVRGADPNILVSLFTDNLQPLGLTWAQISSATVSARLSVEELLLGLEEHGKTPRMRALEKREKP